MPHTCIYETRCMWHCFQIQLQERSVPDIPDIFRHAGVGVLSLRRAPNLGKLSRATRIPAPGPISSSLAHTRSHSMAYVVLHPRENTTTFGAHRGAILCYHAAAGFAVRAGPSSSPPPRRRTVSPIAVGGSTSTRPRSGREGRRALVVGLAFFTTTVATPAVRPHARGLASVGRIHPRAARVCSPPCCALLRPKRAFAPPYAIYAT
ncbi:hypothetical protein VPH35_058253 [Triticum aestivum]